MNLDRRLENDVQLAIRQAKQAVQCNGLCRGPRSNQGRQICISGALGLPDDCASALEGRMPCAALCQQPAQPPASSYEAVRLIAATMRDVWTDEYTVGPAEDFYSYEFDVSDIELCGDFCDVTIDEAKIISVMDEAYTRAGQATQDRCSSSFS